MTGNEPKQYKQAESRARIAAAARRIVQDGAAPGTKPGRRRQGRSVAVKNLALGHPALGGRTMWRRQRWAATA